MAGSEKEGIHAASPYLYENAYYFLTPTDQNSDAACLKLESLIRSWVHILFESMLGSMIRSLRN